MNWIEKVAKLGEDAILANPICENCIFKVTPYEETPCLICKRGKYNGNENNYVEE
jgi:hypothetical protein